MALFCQKQQSALFSIKCLLLNIFFWVSQTKFWKLSILTIVFIDVLCWLHRSTPKWSLTQWHTTPLALLGSAKYTNQVLQIIFSFRRKQKCYPVSLPTLGGLISTRALQSTPFQNPGGVPWAWRRTDEQREILKSNIGFCIVEKWYCIIL